MSSEPVQVGCVIQDLTSPPSRPAPIGLCRLRLQTPTIKIRKMIQRRAHDVIPNVLAVVRELADGRTLWPLYLHGPVGTGKTCAALAVCDMVSLPFHATVEEMADAILDRGRCPWILDPGRLEGYDLAVLDELGARERPTDLNYQAVKLFADRRDGSPAIFVSNLTPHQLRDVYDDRIASRVLCGTILELGGPDRRMLRSNEA